MYLANLQPMSQRRIHVVHVSVFETHVKCLRKIWAKAYHMFECKL